MIQNGENRISPITTVQQDKRTFFFFRSLFLFFSLKLFIRYSEYLLVLSKFMSKIVVTMDMMNVFFFRGYFTHISFALCMNDDRK